jgi:uncharacterized YigZ family protein
MRYPIPAGAHRVEQSVRRSRFIATLAHAPTGDAAHDFIAGIRAEFRGASHNCWAFLAGPPGSTASVGMSDDGEPAGTAGRPMLEVLLHSGVGEVAAVVTRYFGGVKLGKGGLQRAYAGGVALALETLPRTERVGRVGLFVEIGYPALEPVRRLVAALDGELRGERFDTGVLLEVGIPEDSVVRFTAAVADATAGKGRVRGPGG